LEKYARQRRESVFWRLGSVKRQSLPEAEVYHNGRVRREMMEVYRGHTKP
jgi:hypothetical protein